MKALVFLALANHTWGEMTQGVAVARELSARGYTITFLAPVEMKVLLDGQPFRCGFVRDVRLLHGTLAALLRAQRIDALCLVDLSTVYMAMTSVGLAPSLLSTLGVPVFALDAWNTKGLSRHWDLNVGTWRLPPTAATIQHRLVPVPMNHLAADGAYNALPDATPLSHRERIEVRQRFGISTNAPVIVMASAPWQHSGSADHDYNRRLHDHFLPLIVAHLAALPESLLLHVGPAPFAPVATSLGERYTHRAQVDRATFVRLVAASDLVLGYNAAATTIGVALRARVPALVGTCDVSGTDVPGVESALGVELEPAARAFVDAMGEVKPFAAWPMGLHQLLGAVLEDNPFGDTFTRREVLRPTELADAARQLLFDPAVRDRARDAQELYDTRVSALPSAAARVDTWWDATLA